MNIIAYFKDRYGRRNRHIKQRPSKKDYNYKDHFVVAGSKDLPASVDNSHSWWDIKDQSSSQACTGFALKQALEAILRPYSMNIHISPLFNWYYAKKKHGYPSENKGVWIRYTCNSACLHDGVAKTNLMPYSSGKYLYDPMHAAIVQGQEFLKLYFKNKIKYYHTTFSKVKGILADGHNVIFGAYLNNSFYGNRNGLIKNIPNNGSAHAMLLCGYDDEKGAFKVANSWGTRFGKRGYCWIPYAYLKGNGFDYTVIREVSR